MTGVFALVGWYMAVAAIAAIAVYAIWDIFGE